MNDQKSKYILIGAIAGTVIGITQLPRQGYDFSNSGDVSQAIGFLLGFGLFGALIGWLSSRRSKADED